MQADRPLRGIALRLVCVALFSLMAAAMKLADARGAGLIEILFYRQFGAALLITAIIVAGPGLGSVRTERFGAHLWRAGVGVVSMAFGFTAVLALPLAESTAIGFTIPLFATILGALVLREPTGPWRWGAVLVGFAGVLIVTQPGGDSAIPLWAAGVGLIASFLTGIISIMIRSLGRTETTETTVFWFAVLALGPLSILYAFVAQAHPPLVWALLMAVGLFGGAAQLAMTASLRWAPVSVVVPMDYSSLLYAALLGWLLFGVLPAPATWIGAPVIIASGLVIVWREHVRRRIETTQAVANG